MPPAELPQPSPAEIGARVKDINLQEPTSTNDLLVDRPETILLPKRVESAKDRLVRESKLSMLSQPNKIQALIPNLQAPEAELIALGLQKEGEKWYVPNRQYFPNPLGEDSIIINYGQREDGSYDLGFCSQEEFGKIYADSAQYEQGKISYVNTANVKKGEFINATKCATGEFTLVSAGTVVKTNEGEVTVQPGEILIVNENKNSIFVTSIPEILKRYIADPMNPASTEAFELLVQFEEGRKNQNPEELPKLFTKLVENYNVIERKVKTYEAYSTETTIETLRDDYKLASEIVKVLDEGISSRINSLNFHERVNQAREVLKEIVQDPNLAPEQKDLKISYILAKLLPKTNNHQHLKGSVPIETTLALAKKHNLSAEQISLIQTAYRKGAEGFDNLDEFNRAYGAIGSVVRTPEDYQAAVQGIITKATRSGQLTVEIRCSVIGQRDASGNVIDPHLATEKILQAISQSCNEIGEEAPKTGFTFLGYRGRDWKSEEVMEHAKLAVEFAQRYPEKKFSFDLAGPEDTGYSPAYFREAFDLIKAYNNKIKSGELKGELIGVTVHAGETPTYDNGLQGSGAVEEAIAMGADRIGHGVQAVTNPETLDRLKKSSATVEICGVCNVSSIPLNTRGMAVHPIQEFIYRDIPVTICTDNDAICGTNITKEYAQFLLTGHDQLMNWNNVKEAAKQGIKSSFIPDVDKEKALKIFNERVRIIERLITEEKSKTETNDTPNTKSDLPLAA